WEITKGLRFRTMFGVDAALNRTHIFNSSINALNGAAPSTIPSGTASYSEEMDLLNENLLTYETTIKKDHRISAIAGYSAQKNDFKFLSTAGTQYPNNNIQYVAAAGIISGGTEQRSQWSMLSYYGRVNYSFSDKYLLTGTLRRDGSSRFGSNRKYGNFPSAAIGWRVSEEKFMQGHWFYR
ncbi:MAG: TonB-dependent receptor, partial [Segetibacter sp.]